jgi:hypothetical protein
MKLETYARTAALFLTMVLVVGLYAQREPAVASGYYFLLLDDPPPEGQCPHFESDTRTVVLQMGKDGSLRINQDDTDDRQFALQLAEIFKTRAEKVMFIKADPEIMYDLFITRIDELHATIPDLHMVLMTPSWKPGPCSLHIRFPRQGTDFFNYTPSHGWWPRELEPPELRSK